MSRSTNLGDEAGMHCPDCGRNEVYLTELDDDSGRVQASCEECDYITTTDATVEIEIDGLPF